MGVNKPCKVKILNKIYLRGKSLKNLPRKVEKINDRQMVTANDVRRTGAEDDAKIN